MKGSGEFWAAVGEKGQGLSQIVLAHGSLEIGEPKGAGFELLPPPMRVEADSDAAEHPQDPQAIGVAYPATVIIERNVQALVRAILDAPSLAIGPEPRLGREFLGREVSDETDGFVLAPDVLTCHQGDLGGGNRSATR